MMPLDTIEMRSGQNRRRPYLREACIPLPDGAYRVTGWGALTPATIVEGLHVEYELRNGQPYDVRRYAPVPPRERSLLAHHGCTHPGLVLDRFAFRADDQSFTRHTIAQVLEATNGEHPEYPALFNRWRSTIGGEGFTGTTAGPLTLHLARASALENAGICFHRIYGFVYLPGTGLKRLARAFACEVWLGEQSDKAAAWKSINAVFGTAPSPWLNDLAKKHNQPVPKEAASGAIVFHDAWPEEWPRLVTDILNNHHAKYYSDGQPPGDWEDPIPVYFLSVEPGTKFRFAVAKRRDDVQDGLLTLAREWLIGGLTQFGAGAKTASGYGDFTVEEPKVAPAKSLPRPTFEATLELVTPAFLAGATQQAEDCDLRPSTLRGQLRWWWRTLHAGFVSVEDLRKMEAAIWGDTKTGGAVRVTVRPDRKSHVELVPMKSIQKNKKDLDVLRLKPEFKRMHGLIETPNFKTTQGVLYLSYGMDEMPVGRPQERKCRLVIHPGASWKVSIATRPTVCKRDDKSGVVKIDSSMILEQAQAALWLLCRFGGVGSKSRHGFGSLSGKIDGWSNDRVLKVAHSLRQAMPIAEVANTLVSTPALETALPSIELSTPWPDVWFALDQVGFSLQAFAQSNKRKWRKEALGLPRKIGISNEDGTRRQPQYRRSHDRQTQSEIVWLGQFHRYLAEREAEKMRHASPVHFHWERVADRGFQVRVIAFPTALLADSVTSQAVLTELLKHLSDDMPDRVRSFPPPPRPAGGPILPLLTPPTPFAPKKRDTTVRVQVTITGKRAKTGFDVQETGRTPGTLTLGTPPPGVDTSVGAIVTVQIHDDKPDKPQYKWPAQFKGTNK